MCADDLVDFRGKLPRRVHSILFAKSQATGRDMQVIVREVMQQWADDELHAANVMQRVLRSEGVSGEPPGSGGGAAEESKGSGA